MAAVQYDLYLCSCLQDIIKFTRKEAISVIDQVYNTTRIFRRIKRIACMNYLTQM